MILILIYFSFNALLAVFVKLRTTFGGMCMLAQSRGGACFCNRGAMQGYDVVLNIVALAKTVTPLGVPRGSGAGPHRRPLSGPL